MWKSVGIARYAARRLLCDPVIPLFSLLALSEVNASDTVRGMTISSPMDGREWGGTDMRTTMETLRNLGVNWISIHPYAHLDRDAKLRPYLHDRPMVHLTRPIAEAHRLGMKIMIKPHISYWGSFSWRGAIEFRTAQEWRSFFTAYGEWIQSTARTCAAADAFSSGHPA